MKITTDRVTKLMIQIRCSRTGKLYLNKEGKEAAAAEIEEETKIFDTVMLANIEQTLSDSGSGYLTKHGLTVADIAVFNEIANIHAVIDRKRIDKDEYPLTSQWHATIK